MTSNPQEARDNLITYAATTRTVTADGLAPLLDAYRDALLAAAPAAASSSAVGQATRDRIAEALADALKPRYGGPQHNTPGGLPLTATAEEVRLHRAQPLADAALAVLPSAADWDALVTETDRLRREGVALHERAVELDAQVAALQRQVAQPADRTAVLREEAALIRAHCPDHLDSNSAEGSWINCHCDVADDMERRLADEAQQPEGACPQCGDAGACSGGPCPLLPAVGARQPDTQTQAHPPQHAWRVETRDPLADQWAPGSHFAHRPAALERWETANRNAPLWRDGTPVERRIVRETTTYTVEVEHQPASSAVPGRSAATDTHEETRSPVCEGFRWIGQSFATCDRCGQPAWDHDGEEVRVPVEGAGPFDGEWTVRPWKPGQADAIRAKWGTPDADGGPQ